MTRTASLGMYDMPWLHGANDALWAGIAARLRAAGMTDVPETLDRGRPLGEIWRDPGLLLAQTCGYPLMTQLHGDVIPIAAPVYGWPGCEAATHRSFIVVSAASRFAALADLRGRPAAINGWDSNSGMNLFRHAVAKLAGGGAFFSEIVVTGGHPASLEHVANGEADVAAVDCVTFALVWRHRPELVEGVRMIAETAASPVLPFVTRAGDSTGEIAALRDALTGAIADPANRESVEALGLRGVEPVTREDYTVVLDLERAAADRGYPVLR